MTETEQMDNTMPVTSARSKAASDGNTRLMWWWGIGFGLFGMALLLERTGFKLARFYGDWDESPLTDDSERMIIVAEAK